MRESLDLAAEFISKVGFPIFIAVILLWRDEHRHVENISAMRDLVRVVTDQHRTLQTWHIAEAIKHGTRRRRPKDKRR